MENKFTERFRWFDVLTTEMKLHRKTLKRSVPSRWYRFNEVEHKVVTTKIPRVSFEKKHDGRRKNGHVYSLSEIDHGLIYLEIR